MAKEKMSASRLADYLTCHLLYRFKHVNRLPPKKVRGPVVLGIGMHALINDVYAKDKFNVKWMIGNWKKYFLEAEKKEPVKFKNNNDRNFWMRQGYPMIHLFFRTAKKYGLLKKPIWAEKYFKIKYKDFYLTGRMDIVIQVDDLVFVLDFKTSRKQPSQKEMDEDNQLTFYSWAYRKLTDAKEDNVGIFNVRHGKIFKSKRTRGDYFKLAIKIIQTVIDIRNKKFEPNYKNCKYCDYKKECKEEYPK